MASCGHLQSAFDKQQMASQMITSPIPIPFPFPIDAPLLLRAGHNNRARLEAEKVADDSPPIDFYATYCTRGAMQNGKGVGWQ